MSSAPRPDDVLDNVLHATLPNRLMSVAPNELISVAITRMVAFDYSQMPVLTGGQETGRKELVGIVTWKSIASGIVSKSLDDDLPRCADACEPPQSFHRFTVDTPIADVLDILVINDFVITEQDHQFHGIMTPADIVRWVDMHGMGLVEIRSAEMRLRELLCVSQLPLEEPLKEMSFGDLQSKMSSREFWSRVRKTGNWTGINKSVFIELVNEARKARNDLAHFKYEACPEKYSDSRRDIATLVRLLRFIKDGVSCFDCFEFWESRSIGAEPVSHFPRMWIPLNLSRSCRH